MMRWRVHVLHEHGTDGRPFGSAYIRLLRPLSHPTVSRHLQVTSGLEYEGQPVDMVLVDRLWRPDISPTLASQLVEAVRRARARLIYAVDDNFLDMGAGGKGWKPTEDQLWAIRFFLSQADRVLVTTPALKERLAAVSSDIRVLPQALDERLLACARRPSAFWSWLCAGRYLPGRRLVIGYMGTYTHDDDLLMVLPALRAVCARHPDRVEFELLGVLDSSETLSALEGLPVSLPELAGGQDEYPMFMAWFSRRIHWDIAISPLQDTVFNRCKSDIKFLDYAAISAAGIYSRVPAYSASVRHLETGWLAENTTEAWTEALETLLTHRALRAKLARNARHYLLRRRTLAHCAYRWVKALTE